ncbi:MAG: PrsW family intramembrane metalloprotease [Lachnospiraceae bacterium]|nr:PrsW family intramembrane metalloprotease [Lachnospiraceae bacterium]
MELIWYLFLTVCAVIPPTIFLIYIYFKDKADKEPLWLLAILFILGMITVIPDMIFEIIPEVILSYVLDPASFLFRVLNNFLIIALVEEFFKFAVMFPCTWFSKHFNYRFDGIVYAVFTSLGMATVENILYVLQHGFVNAIMRAILSIPGHTFFAVFMGYYYGLAKQAHIEKRYGKMTYYLCVSLIVPIFMHGFYDYCSDFGSIPRILLFFLFVFVMYVAAFVRVHISSKKDQAFIKEQQVVYLTPAQAANPSIYDPFAPATAGIPASAAAYPYGAPGAAQARQPVRPGAPGQGMPQQGRPMGPQQGMPQQGRPMGPQQGMPQQGRPMGPQAGMPQQGAQPVRPAAPQPGMPQQSAQPAAQNTGYPFANPGTAQTVQPAAQAAQPTQPTAQNSGYPFASPGAAQTQPSAQTIQPAVQNSDYPFANPGTTQTAQPTQQAASVQPDMQASSQAVQPEPQEAPQPAVDPRVFLAPPGQEKPSIKISSRAKAYIFCRGCGNLCRSNSFYCPSCGTLIHGTGPIQKKNA